ncbi:uncharacterized protein LOC123611833 [Camelus bactrianus]|uniref:Uncharacterized protein LOC123611833 n=1 Tax=Camelus bactrianus TaxID=9837 RepID=A0AC58QK71_CAMBA
MSNYSSSAPRNNPEKGPALPLEAARVSVQGPAGPTVGALLHPLHSGHAQPAPGPQRPGRPGTDRWPRRAAGSPNREAVRELGVPSLRSGSGPAERLGLRVIGGRAGHRKAFPHRPVSVHQEADFSYLPRDRKPPVPPHPSPPPLAHGEPVLPPPPPPPHLLAPPAVSASPGVSAGLRHGPHSTRRGGSHSSSSAQARSDRTHGARTAGRVASYYGGRFGLTSAPPPPSPQCPVPSCLTALLRTREDAGSKRACVGCVHSIQICPIGTRIRCRGRDFSGRGGVPVLGNGQGCRKWEGFARRRSFVGKPAWPF